MKMIYMKSKGVPILMSIFNVLFLAIRQIGNPLRYCLPPAWTFLTVTQHGHSSCQRYRALQREDYSEYEESQYQFRRSVESPPEEREKVERLIDIFEVEGCLQFDSAHIVPVTISKDILSQIPPGDLHRSPPEQVSVGGAVLKCIHGFHRLWAAEAFLPMRNIIGSLNFMTMVCR